ncbi:hypothetical protein A4H97_05650 [Niastella yeongjuensis]|uniref:Uncharacterized protein n=1 Tax=Niastella yeongjuensis TaxID=354355 RepID=A0A1V9ELQ2_9BACT|nr:hypothetical protein A4H97_05650 [Niastella yeongjuensis]SEN64939.1 hypothetical protein SAMN05660816_01155 [Niastella yeongjuensis]
MVKAFFIACTVIRKLPEINDKEDIPLEKKIFHGSDFVTSTSRHPINLTHPGSDKKLIDKIPLAALLLRNLSRQYGHKKVCRKGAR